MDPERCNLKADQKAKSQWAANQVRQLGHYEDVGSPIINMDENMKEDIKPVEIGREDRQETRADLPPIGSGSQTT